MSSLRQRFRRWTRAAARGATGPPSFGLEVERLEQRQVPSHGGSAAFASGAPLGNLGGSDGVYTLFQDGSVWAHTGQSSNAGWTQLTSTSTVGATAVSAGLSYAYEVPIGQPNPQPIALTLNAPFVLFQDGSVWEYANVNPVPFSPIQDGWVQVTGGGARQISAVQTVPNPVPFSNAATYYNSVYVLFRGGSVWQHTGLDPSAGWTEVTGGGARQISAGTDGSGNAIVFVRFQDGSVWSHTGTDPSAGWTEVTGSGARYLSASTAAADTVFVGFGAGQVWEHTGMDPNAGWSEVSGGGVTGLGVGSTLVENIVNGSISWETEPAAFVMYSDGSVWSHTGTDPSAGWSEVTGGGATAVYAAQVATDTAFVNFGGDLWEYIAPGTYNAGWYEVSSGGVI